MSAASASSTTSTSLAPGTGGGGGGEGTPLSVHSTPTHGSVLVKRTTVTPLSDVVPPTPPHPQPHTTATTAVSQGSSKQSTPSHARDVAVAKQETDEELKEETHL